MKILDIFRQIYLLLWKNFVLRKRKKIRLVVEILWPLFLFLILMWVRTRGLKSNEAQCHFAEKPLPSGGILPFVRGYICELNYSCSRTPRESFNNQNLFELTQLTSDSLQVLNQQETISSVTTLISFLNVALKQRDLSAKITGNLSLSESLSITNDVFKQELTKLSLSPSPLTEAFVNLVLNSNPSFNYLYSNFSTSYNEPLSQLEFLGAPKSLINVLYGPDLDRIETRRVSNRVYNSSWIRSEMCLNGTNYLLRGNDKESLKTRICNLDDTQITNLFILISSKLDYTKVKKKVYDETLISNSSFYDEGIKAATALLKLQEVLKDSNSKYGISSLNELLAKYQSLNLAKELCSGSSLSLFDIFASLNFKRFDSKSLNKILFSATNNQTQASRLIDLITNDFEFSSKAWQSTENLGRMRSFKINKQNNPFLKEKSGSVNPNSRSTTSNTTSTENDLEFATTLFASFNNLNKLPPSKCPAKQIDLDESTQFLLNSTTKSCFCQTIYSIINSLSQDTRILFGQIKPMFLGKLLYAPNTPAYQKLIKRVNASFANIDKIVGVIGNIADLGNRVLTQFNLNTPEDINLFETQLQQNLTDILNFNLTQNGINIKQLINQLRFTTQLLYFTRNSLQCFEINKFEGFATEDQVVQTGIKLIDKEAFWGAIIFQNSEEVINGEVRLPKVVKYKIRMNASQTHDTVYTQDRIYSYGASNCIGCNSYYMFGFIYIQDMLEKGIIEMKTNRTQEFGIIGQMTPYPCYVNDKFITAIARTLPLFMVLAWIYTVSMMVKDIVYEKEKRLKEFMRVMGLSNGIHWLSWFITSFITMFIIILILCLVIKYGKITTYSDLSVLIVFFTCFTLATITQCFLISVFFNKANLAAVVAGIIYFLLYLPYTLLVNYSEVILPWQKFLASLSSTVAFSYGCELISAYEQQTKGVQWSNFYSTPFSTNDTFTMNYICLIMLLDSVIYMTLTWYIEGIAPGEFGLARKLYFPFQPSYWLEKLIKEEEAREDLNSKRGVLGDSVEIISDQVNKTPGIEIQRLHKVYSRGNNHALKGLSLNFYQNEISAFLGHNGAGKSTTMHLLTGLYSPTSGTAKINGLDITESMDTIRKSLGFVPQHNVLFPGMTVKEHLWFYARLKGLDRDSTLKETEKMLDDTGLRPKKNDLSKDLSGGMQRKLSVAIAFVGDSRTVILDEPSAGVDPSGRRSIWDLLFKYRIGRTIIISTHHMDEADVLGDRIAIISNGKLIAHGTSYFLKNKFGRGYYLTFAKRQMSEDDLLTLEEQSSRSSTLESSSTDSGARSMSSFSSFEHKVVEGEEEVDLDDYEKSQIKNEEECLKTLSGSRQDSNLYEFVKTRIPNAILVENIGSEMTFSISNKAEFTKNYEKFFHQVELNMQRLGIDSIGMSDTTLEEIFIKLAKEPKSNSFQQPGFKLLGLDLTNIKNKLMSIPCLTENTAKLTNEQLEEYSVYTKKRVDNKVGVVAQQLYALILKRMHRVKRNIKGFFAEIVLPVIFVCLALLVATLTPKVSDRPSLELHPWYYGSPNTMFLSKSSSIKYETTFYNLTTFQVNIKQDSNYQPNIDAVNRISNALINNPGPGTRCMKGHKIVISKQAEDFRRSFDNKELDCEPFDLQLKQNYTLPSNSFNNELSLTNFTFTKKSLDCDCSAGFPKCPESAGGDINLRNVYNLKTKDQLYDLTSRNLTDWLIKTEFSDQFFRRRFGGFEFMRPYIQVNNQLAENLFVNLQQFVNSVGSLFNQIGEVFNNTNQSVSFSNLDTSGSNPLIANQNVKIWYNTKGYDSNVAYLNVLNNAILRSLITEMNQNQSNSSLYMDPSEHGIVAFNHPMSFTRTQFLSQLERRVMIDLFVAVCIIFALSFIPASFLVFLLEERENNSKQLQFVSGVRPYIYWISNFSWDMVNYMVPCILCIIIFVIFDVKAYMSKENFPCLVALMLLYGWACIPLMYPLNYLFKVPSTAFVISSSLNVFIGVISTMTTTVLSQLGDEEPDLLVINNILKKVFVILFPHYCLGQGFIEMAQLYNVAEVKRGYGYKAEYDPFKFDSNGRNLLAMAAQGVVFFTLNLLIQYKFFIRFKPESDVNKLKLPVVENEDDDVNFERKRILQSESNTKHKKRFNFIRKRIGTSPPMMNNQDLNEETSTTVDEDYIRLVNLTKVYKKFKKFRYKKHVAVNNLSIGINKGECFGLIGVNGAGKTTTFKMITGEIPISGGDVYVNGYSVSRQIERVHRNIGYCPQTDAIIPLLTAREHLIFFARLRGIPEKYVRQVSEWAMHRVGLTVFADRISGDFSGGNKRKLSTAIGLVGNPSVICLDEPTSGMDAKARRLLWNDIISLIKENRIVILTSHSMEECEALCTRLVIMVNGQFKCLGSPQHLKSKFGNGYKLSIRLNNENEKMSLYKFMKENFPTSSIQETHRNLFEYILPFSDTKLSQIFGKIEDNREILNIKDYSVSQTTLDQVFINFAKLQNEDPFKDQPEQVRVVDAINLTSLEDRAKSVSLNAARVSLDEKDVFESNRKESVGSENKLDEFAFNILPKMEAKPDSFEITHL